MKIRNSLIHFFVFLPILAMVLIPNYSYYWDGVEYAWLVENASFDYAFHQHHLIFTPFWMILYNAVTGIGIGISALNLMISVDIVAGITFLIFSYKIFKKLFPDNTSLLLAGTLFIGISYTFGSHIRNAEPHIIPITILTILAWRVMPSPGKHFKVVLLDWLLLVLAISFHQVSILILPALVYAQIQSGQSNKWKGLLLNFSVFVLVTLALYLAVYHFMTPHKPYNTFFAWIIGYGRENYWVFSETKGFIQVVLTSVQTDIISHKNLFLPEIYASFKTSTGESNFGFKEFAVCETWFFFLLVFVSIILGAINLLKDRKSRSIAVFWFIWIVPFFILFHFFAALNSFYRLFYILPLVIFIINALHQRIRKRQEQIGVLILFMFFILINFSFGFIPQAKRSINPYLTWADEIQNQASPDDLFIYFGNTDYRVWVYHRYFSDTNLLMMNQFPHDKYPEMTQADIETACTNTSTWLNDNFDRIYLARGMSKYSEGYLQITTESSSTEIPENAILNFNQFDNLGTVNIGIYPFNVVEVKAPIK